MNFYGYMKTNYMTVVVDELCILVFRTKHAQQQLRQNDFTKKQDYIAFKRRKAKHS